MKKKLFLFLTVLALIVSAAYGIRAFFVSPSSTVPLVQQDQEEKEVNREEKITQEPLMRVFRIAPTGTAAMILYHPDPQFVSAWVHEPDDVIAINGGYFHEDYSPSGFLVAEGKRIGSRMFDQDKSGLVAVKDGRVSLRDLNEFPIKKGEQFDGAIQSYPFLIKNSQPAIREDSGKLARRTAVGADAHGVIYVIVIPDREISLFAFMNELIATGIRFTHVLNLDGGPSTGIYANWNGEMVKKDSIVPVSSAMMFRKND